jgi:hypothetical protein
MTGFLVGNSFGTFNSKKTDNTKIFNAVQLFDFPDGVTSISGRKMRNEIRDWSEPGQRSGKYLYSGTAGNKKGMGWAHQYENDWLTPANNTFFNRWTGNDAAVMRDDEDSMQYFRPAPNVTMEVEIGFYNCTAGDNYNYTSGGGLDIPSALRTKDGYREFVTVTLNGNDGDYIFIDYEDDLGANTFDQPVAQDSNGAPYAVVIKSQEGTWKSHYDPDDDDCGTVYIKPLKAWYTKEGCTDDEATNYDPTAGINTGCAYYRADPTLTLNKTEVREGSPVKISWSLDNSGNKGYDKIELYDGSSKIKTSSSKSSYYNYTPTGIGNHIITIKVIWNHGTLKDDRKTLSVVDAVSFIPCTDPNRETDVNGECDTDCNSGYYMDSDTGLCSKCQDPNRQQETDGRCGDCESGYALDSDNLCVKSGCMDEDDYEYDPDAVIDDPSACAGTGDIPADVDCVLSEWGEWSNWSDPDTESGTRTRGRTIETAASGNGVVCESLEEIETGVVDPDTGEITITTSGGDLPADDGGTPPADDETGSPVVPIVIGVAVLGALFMFMRR